MLTLGTCHWPASRVWVSRFPHGAEREFSCCHQLPVCAKDHPCGDGPGQGIRLVGRHSQDRDLGGWEEGPGQKELLGGGDSPLSLLNQIQAPRACPFVPRSSPLQDHSVAPRSFPGEEGVEFFKGQMSNIDSRSFFAF